jgi:hypothetical protein
MPKVLSRAARWQDAVSKAAAARDRVTEAANELSEALGELRDIQEEYSEWRDNLPENLASSALAEKLDTVVDEIDLDSSDEPLSDWDTITEAIDAAEGADLPLGFGRD